MLLRYVTLMRYGKWKSRTVQNKKDEEGKQIKP